MWEEFSFKDMSLWETFQEDFKDFIEEDFKSASSYYLCKLWDHLQKFGIWIPKQERFNIARILYKGLLKKEPTNWTEEELMKFKDKEKFISFQIN